ncbi:MAG: transcriptional regulator, partial [Muribaculaceae bacterium]|nr:transcriptional regulator [Muribaculaceae bacterium]
PGVQKQLSHIQTAIEQNISHDDDWSTFNRNFDVVYGDYTKRLHELHPQLSQADIRLCCYIKMGLTSKEIAPLINISFKSVEMARYRLRKKIGLSPDRSLTDYIASL